jgi:hypothetical protein
MTAGVLRAAGGGQRLQDRADQGGALRGQVAGQDPGAAERGLQPDGTVLERLPRVIVTGVRAGAGLVLLGSALLQNLRWGAAPPAPSPPFTGDLPAAWQLPAGPAAPCQPAGPPREAQGRQDQHCYR